MSEQAPLNFHPVDPTRRVYRSGQPVKLEEWEFVANILGPSGQVIKLNTGDDDAQWVLLGRQLFAVPIPWFEQIIDQPDYQELTDALGWIGVVPTLVHCTRGIDRTGLVIALWRVLYCGWTVDDAEEEWKQYGGDEWCLPGLLKAWNDLAPAFAEQYRSVHH